MRCYLRACALVLPLIVLVLSQGCKNGGPSNLAPVSGRVTLDNQPLKGATVRFQPDKGGGDSIGMTDDNGTYTLQWTGTKSGAPGAVPGKHWVQISLIDREKDGKELVPDKYSRYSTLHFDVPAGGSKSADFALKK